MGSPVCLFPRRTVHRRPKQRTLEPLASSLEKPKILQPQAEYNAVEESKWQQEEVSGASADLPPAQQQQREEEKDLVEDDCIARKVQRLVETVEPRIGQSLLLQAARVEDHVEAEGRGVGGVPLQ
eukprot:CAMPEP_0181177168 /NCGR_PEP_ID=MMETSP1096-20121128/5024_1 /TAXON_ID=156174 ORGANISM="Chrysochromulina ericina, Strain CCMP281" /NCGR_SAMPLE_ID=MMETSP1096 /ASSEMBLY_ACC=CAM_ASM_000453 /LENGTH=124 /DNA_ID=CAMNT_0023265315 /DNA_START=222 /DNA_END=596 /DNA_ORIENTATION=+